MHRITISLLVLIAATAASTGAADRHWQTGTWADVTTRRKLIDFGPGSSGFGRPSPTPSMRAMADVRRFVIETDTLRLELEDTVPVGRRSIDPAIGGMATFALDKNAVYVRMADATEHKLRLVKKTEKKTDRPRATPAGKPAYMALGGGHLVRAVSRDGRYVTLEDGSVWDIEPGRRFQTLEWEPTASVTVRARDERGFGYELINTNDDEAALANLVPK